MSLRPKTWNQIGKPKIFYSLLICIQNSRSLIFRFAHAIMWDTGTSVGNLAGQAKPINNVDIKQNRPYRAVTASEDYTVSFFEGPPFKYKDQIKVRDAKCVY